MDSYLVKVFWDFFIVEGWKGFFKCVLFLMRYHEENLLKLTFENSICFLGEILRKGLMIKSY